MGDQASERIGTPVVVLAMDTEGRRWPSREISCRLHDGWILRKWLSIPTCGHRWWRWGGVRITVTFGQIGRDRHPLGRRGAGVFARSAHGSCPEIKTAKPH